MLKKFASSCAAIIVVTAVSIPTQARVVRVSGDHVGNLTGTRVVAANGSIYRSGVWRGQYGHNGYRYGRYAYGYRPYWRLWVQRVLPASLPAPTRTTTGTATRMTTEMATG
ncbi:MAG: hypothetical protein WA905_07745 [Pseudolabrys sp.]